MSSPYEVIDNAYAANISNHPDATERWLLLQTLYTGHQRRSMLPFLPLQPGMRVLDVGTGFGALAFDLAAQIPLQIEAIDVNLQELQIAQKIHQDILQKAALQESHIRFSGADVYTLPYANGTFDFAISRFVFQHLTKPEQALVEIHRVLRPGGMVCLMDIDDQLNISYPEPNPAYQRLEEAFRQLQVRKGGDRYVGRKLSHYLRATGFANINPLLVPQAQFVHNEVNSTAAQFTMAKFQQAREDIVEQGILTNEEFDLALKETQQQSAFWSFDATSQIVVLGTKVE